MPDRRWHMKTVLITGCSSGYGKATAELFLKKGWNVIATMRNPDAGVLGGVARTLRVVRLDVTDDSSVALAVKEGIAAFGGIDVLVNNAGIGLMSVFEATPLTTVRELFETNTFGAMALTQALIPHMRERGGGTIVN